MADWFNYSCICCMIHKAYSTSYVQMELGLTSCRSNCAIRRTFPPLRCSEGCRRSKSWLQVPAAANWIYWHLNVFDVCCVTAARVCGVLVQSGSVYAGGLHRVDLCGAVTPIHLVLEKHTPPAMKRGLEKKLPAAPTSVSTATENQLLSGSAVLSAACSLATLTCSRQPRTAAGRNAVNERPRVVFQLWRSPALLDHSITS